VVKSTFAAFADRLGAQGLSQPDFKAYTPAQIKTDLLAGLTVALALVPEAVAFAFVAHVHPLVGLYAAFIVGLVTALIGGRPGMISGATGALAVVMVSLVSTHGVEYLFATVVVMGILQLLAGIFRMGKFIRLVPHPVMLGFVNGLAIVIFLAQLTQFQVPGSAEEAAGHGMASGEWLSGMPLVLMLALVALTMIDFDTQLLPDGITLPLMWLGLVLNYFGVLTDFSSAFWGAVAGYLSLWSVYWLFKLVTGKEGMGHGDFKLLAALGAWLGWQLLPAVILLSSLVGAIVGISLMVFRKHGREVPIPFGPYLAAAGLLSLWFGPEIQAIWFGYLGV